MRRTLFKTYSLILLMLTLLFGFGFAENVNDCELATTISSGIGVNSGTWSSYSLAFPYQNLVIAANNLYAYCCKANLFSINSKIDCKNAPKDVYLESQYMVEHLVDVGFRQLDYLSAYSGQLVDSGAKAWYDVLHPTGDKLALTPLMVQAQYKKYRTLTHLPLLQNEAGDIKNYLPLYSGFSLRDKYYNLCYVVKNAYEKVLQPTEKDWSLYIGKPSDASSYYNDCMNLADKKVGQELTITQTLMIEGSTATLKNTMETYLMTNFIKDSFLGLVNKFQSIVSLFEKIVRQAPVSKRCAQ